MDFLGRGMRLLADEDDPPPERWELIFMSFVMFFLFAALITDRVAPDHVFVIAVSFCMVTGIVTIEEGLQGFANEGVLTVMVRTHACCTRVTLRPHCFLRVFGMARPSFRSAFHYSLRSRD